MKMKTRKKKIGHKSYLFLFGGGVGGEAESKPSANSPSTHRSWHANLTIIIQPTK